MKESILIIDDDEQLSDVLCLVLESAGYEVQTCSTPSRALELIGKHSFSLILLDLRLGDFNGIDFLPKLREWEPNIPVFIITAHGDVDSAVDAFTLGANGYIRKPFRDGDLKAQIAQAIEAYRLKAELRSAKSRQSTLDIRSLIRSRDPAMEPVLQRISIAATVGSNVVITGESGTGKEIVARALHRCGPRAEGPFVAFNCAALPETLLEAELFGHVRGAFTDAKEAKPGLFARANGGTLFLDEIGDAPASIQTKLLRVLQEREVLPLGSSIPIRIDVRMVAATHKSLHEEVAAGRFRQDLFYRLHVLPIHLPPLRERRKDILFLASLLASQLAERLGLGFEGFTLAAESALESYDWPGNIRELQNRLEQAMVISRGGKLSARVLFTEMGNSVEPEPELAPEPDPQKALPTFFEAKESFERNYLERVLSVAKGNIAKAARLASKSRTEVYKLLRKHDLDPDSFKGGETPRL